MYREQEVGKQTLGRMSHFSCIVPAFCEVWGACSKAYAGEVLKYEYITISITDHWRTPHILGRVEETSHSIRVLQCLKSAAEVSVGRWLVVDPEILRE